MDENPRTPLLMRALLIGVLSGSRSFTPLAVLALLRETAPAPVRDWPVFRSPVGRGVLAAAALGELVGDKLPATPARTSPGPLVGRAATGALSGFALASSEPSRPLRAAAAALGAAGAVLGSFGGFLGRGAAGRATGLPDPVLALVEDAIAVGGSVALVRTA